MRAVLLAAILLTIPVGAAVMAQGPIRLEQGFTGFGPGPAPRLDLAPPPPELPRETLQPPGLRLGPGAVLTPSTLDQLDLHDPHRVLERGLPSDGGNERGLTPLLPERFGATVTVPF
jgi:hypothetical protein